MLLLLRSSTCTCNRYRSQLRLTEAAKQIPMFAGQTKLAHLWQQAQRVIQLLDLVDLCYPTGSGHIIFDNLSTHMTDEVVDWFEEHPRWKAHFTPTHASWLNQIECAFAELQRCVLARGSFSSTEDLRVKVYEYLWWHNELAKPFQWSYRPKSWSNNSGQTSGGRH